MMERDEKITGGRYIQFVRIMLLGSNKQDDILKKVKLI